MHLVRLEKRTPSRLAPFAEIRERVVEVYGEQRRAERNEEEYRRMRERYEVVVESPARTDAAPAAGAPAQ
jgi:hypothetical protein